MVEGIVREEFEGERGIVLITLVGTSCGSNVEERVVTGPSAANAASSSVIRAVSVV